MIIRQGILSTILMLMSDWACTYDLGIKIKKE